MLSINERKKEKKTKRENLTYNYDKLNMIIYITFKMYTMQN